MAAPVETAEKLNLKTAKELLKLKVFQKLDYNVIDIMQWSLCYIGRKNKFYACTVQKGIFNENISLCDRENYSYVDGNKIKIKYAHPLTLGKIDNIIDLGAIKFNYSTDAKNLFENVLDCQTDDSKKLIQFTNIYCSLVKKILKDSVINELNNSKRNQISINLFISLLTTFSLIKKGFNPDKINRCDETVSLIEAGNKYSKITNFLYQKLITEKKYPEQLPSFENELSKGDFAKKLISFDTIHLILNDNSRLATLSNDIEKTILELLNINQKYACDSMVNFFIARLIISLITLNRLPQEPPPIKLNEMLKLTQLAEANQVTVENMFETILENKIDWYVRIKEPKIIVEGSPSSQSLFSHVPLLPMLAVERYESIKEALIKKVPYFKLAESDDFGNPMEYSVLLKNKNQIRGDIYLALPEELRYLEKWHFSIKINGVIKLDDIAIPKEESNKLQLTSSLNRQQMPIGQKIKKNNNDQLLSRSAIKKNFTKLTQDAWDKRFEREEYNGLSEAKMDNGKRILYRLNLLEKWLVQEGIYTIEKLQNLVSMKNKSKKKTNLESWLKLKP